jgi:hypothetical protein
MPREETDTPYSPEYEKRLMEVEEETEQKVSHTISAIESAVESWKAAGKRPDELRLQIVRLQRFCDRLAEWERNSLIESKKSGTGQRIMRLRRYVDICSEYERETGS